MTKRMLIDAAHTEEVRMVIIDNDKLEDFEVETAGKEQIKGNIYVGEVTRVEPSLQAAFIAYGGNRNGFLAFSEIHPNFFEIDDDEKKELLQELNDIANRRKNRDKIREEEFERRQEEKAAAKNNEDVDTQNPDAAETPESLEGLTPEELEEDARALALANQGSSDDQQPEVISSKRPRRHVSNDDTDASEEEDDSTEDTRIQPIHRRYNIADVVKEGQKILIQVNKEERGNKGAALSTYISLPGRFCVLMPNTPYAGGISRKITDFKARRSLKNTITESNLPENMGLIIRTAGVGQEDVDIHRDIDNLVSLWKSVEESYDGTETTSTLLHEDGSLAVRTVRDMLSNGIDEVIISGRKTYRGVKDYVKNLMPDSAKIVKEHRAATPILTHYGIEDKISRLHATRVTLPSGGYLIINPTEALVSIDVNSGRATQEKNIEETAYKTNLEAAEEVARQLRLRDLAGLVVVDFIDMEENKHERNVEKAMRRAVKIDRARVQIAPISQFGLLEMSRQRLRPSLGESTMVACPHCHGTGLVQSLETAALSVLRSLEKEDVRKKADKVTITTSTELAVFILNNKRELIRDIESRYKLKIYIRGDDRYVAPDHRLDIIQVDGRGMEKSHTIEISLRDNPEEEDKPKRSRSRRSRKRDSKQETSEDISAEALEKTSEEEAAATESSEKKPRRRRSRGGRGRRKEVTSGEQLDSQEESTQEVLDVKKPAKRSRKKQEKPTLDDQTSTSKDTATDKDATAEKKPRRRRATKKKVDDTSSESAKSKSAGITVETIDVSGEKSVENVEKPGTVGKVFQRWWSKVE